MSVSNINICNLALTMLSTERIADINENSENARKLKAIYEMTRDGLLAEHNWNFARKEAKLSLVSNDVLTGDWRFIYQLPVKCLRVIRMAGDYAFAIYGDKLYTNVDSPVIEYQEKVTDPSLFSSGFIRAFALRLAADLSFGITQNATLSQAMEAKAKDALKEAVWTDSQEGVGTRVLSGSLLEER